MLERGEELRSELVSEAVSRPVGGRPARIGYPDDGSLGAVILDLAIQAVGAVPVPLPPGDEAQALAVIEAADVDLRLLVAAEPPRPAWVACPPPGAEAALAAPGPFAVWEAGGWAELPAAALAGRVERLSRTLAEGGPLAGRRRPAREIVLLPRSLADPWGRSLWAWSIAAGAALVLEPDPELRPDAALWARPTVFAGSADELERFRQRLGERRGRSERRRARRRLPLGRLHTVVALEAAPGSVDEERWRRLGVAVAVV